MSYKVFPINPGKTAWKSSRKQSWDIIEYKSASGKRKTMTHQEYPGWSFSISFPALSNAETNKLLAFYANRKGSWEPFWYKDYEQYRVVEKTLKKQAEGFYQAVIPCGEYEEPCGYVDNVVVYVDGRKTENFTVDGGKIYVNEVGSKVRFDYEYYWLVAFDTSITDEEVFDNVHKVSMKLTVVR